MELKSICLAPVLYSEKYTARRLSLQPLTMTILLPAGISFYFFQSMGYLIDVYRGKIEAEKHFGYYALFVSFFPQLLSGPIGRADSLLPQYRKKRSFSYDNVTYGLHIIPEPGRKRNMPAAPEFFDGKRKVRTFEIGHQADAEQSGTADSNIGIALWDASRPINYLKTAVICLDMSYVQLVAMWLPVLLLGIYDYLSLKYDVIREFSKLKFFIRWPAYVLLLIAIILFSPKGIATEFIYFQF